MFQICYKRRASYLHPLDAIQLTLKELAKQPNGDEASEVAVVMDYNYHEGKLSFITQTDGKGEPGKWRFFDLDYWEKTAEIRKI